MSRSPTGASSWTYGFGAQVYPSPSDHTHAGQATLAADPNLPGSLGLATPSTCNCRNCRPAHGRRAQE
jgi:predicted alternative tryptophan synthase beta-subunit